MRGRFIDEQRTYASRRVAVINEAFARRFFPNEDPLGQDFGVGDASHTRDCEIVAIVGDIEYYDAYSPMNAMAFFPLSQAREDNGNIFHEIQLLVAGAPQNLPVTLQQALAGVDPNLTVIRAITFDDQFSRNFNGERLVARLTTLYGLLALIPRASDFTASRRTPSLAEPARLAFASPSARRGPASLA